MVLTKKAQNPRNTSLLTVYLINVIPFDLVEGNAK